jgi:hypothetical protein
MLLHCKQPQAHTTLVTTAGEPMLGEYDLMDWKEGLRPIRPPQVVGDRPVENSLNLLTKPLTQWSRY